MRGKKWVKIFGLEERRFHPIGPIRSTQAPFSVPQINPNSSLHSSFFRRLHAPMNTYLVVDDVRVVAVVVP